MNEVIGMIFKIGGPILAGIVIILVLASGYLKAPPDVAYVISGLR